MNLIPFYISVNCRNNLYEILVCPIRCWLLPLSTIKWINNTREFCPKGQFVYFVGNIETTFKYRQLRHIYVRFVISFARGKVEISSNFTHI
uniref:Uncharacterized protein n=1 Tax=Arundo donax TaxID=35708 RepID=A0A0A9FFT0_ARUDO